MARRKSEARVLIEKMVLSGSLSKEIRKVVLEQYPDTKNVNVTISQVRKNLVKKDVVEEPPIQENTEVVEDETEYVDDDDDDDDEDKEFLSTTEDEGWDE